jgi:hypothetical protein
VASKSRFRGHEIEFDERNDTWIYCSDGAPVPENLDRKCDHCGIERTKEDHDGCLGTLDGLGNACCGHGVRSDAYVQFLDGTSIHGEDAALIQEILKRNRSAATNIEKLVWLTGACKFIAQEVEKETK